MGHVCLTQAVRGPPFQGFWPHLWQLSSVETVEMWELALPYYCHVALSLEKAPLYREKKKMEHNHSKGQRQKEDPRASCPAASPRLLRLSASLPRILISFPALLILATSRKSLVRLLLLWLKRENPRFCPLPQYPSMQRMGAVRCVGGGGGGREGTEGQEGEEGHEYPNF